MHRFSSPVTRVILSSIDLGEEFVRPFLAVEFSERSLVRNMYGGFWWAAFGEEFV